jgi:hypothetical protein
MAATTTTSSSSSSRASSKTYDAIGKVVAAKLILKSKAAPAAARLILNWKEGMGEKGATGRQGGL